MATMVPYGKDDALVASGVPAASPAAVDDDDVPEATAVDDGGIGRAKRIQVGVSIVSEVC